LRAFLAGDPDQVASTIVEVEVVRAVGRVAPDLTRKAEEVVRRLSVIEVAESIRARAALLQPAAVRSLDALHLATAIEVGPALDAVITYDARMAAAARSHGLAVTAPA
jgi:uncharacterized protein